jgi:hypothetical protein
VKAAPRKCREISVIKTSFGFAPAQLHRTIPRGPATVFPDRARARSWSRQLIKSAPAVIDADGCAANPTARALLPVAGRW